MRVGYKVLNVDYDDEKSGGGGFEWKVKSRGPTLSLVIDF